METETSKLAYEIEKQIKREDFHYEVKKYFIFKMVQFIKAMKKIKEEWWDNL